MRSKEQCSNVTGKNHSRFSVVFLLDGTETQLGRNQHSSVGISGDELTCWVCCGGSKAPGKLLVSLGGCVCLYVATEFTIPVLWMKRLI